jgi:RNA 2',3'-cyclic 3'-phosphodiesterase
VNGRRRHGPGDPLRCFLALSPDAGSRDAMRRGTAMLASTMAGVAHGVRWVAPEALHLTLRFLGPATNAQIEYLRHMLPALAAILPPLAARRYAIWPNRSRPRLLVLELEISESLSQLAQACEDHARKAGFEPETRGFRAHLTLARLRPGCAFGVLPPPPRALAFDAVTLMQSTLTQPSATYREVARAELAPVVERKLG